MKTLLIFIYFAVLLSCTNHEFTSDEPSEVLAIAAQKCSQSDMAWFTTLLQQASSSQIGAIYAANIDGRTFFIHQPLIMSCLACVIYDCGGNRIDIATVDLQRMAAAMTPGNRIYDPPRD